MILKLSCFTYWAQSNHKGLLGNSGESESVVDVTMEIRGWSDGGRDLKLRNVEKGNKMNSPLKPPERKHPCQHLNFRFVTFKTVKE